MSQPVQARAAVCRAVDGPITVETLTVKPPGPGEVMLRLSACGVCHSDLSIVTGTIRGALPMVLGHEGAGVIEAVGPGVTEFAVGDTVLSSFISMCGRCRYCATGRPQLCDQPATAALAAPGAEPRFRDARGEGMQVFAGCGVMAEVATLSTDSVVKVPGDVPMDKACLISCGVMTGVGAAFNTAKVSPGDITVVFGCGGVGLSAIQGCRIAGAGMIVAVDTLDFKLQMARDMGATHVVNARTVDNVVKAVLAMTGGGADFAFECVGVGDIVAQAVGVLAKGGTAVAVGVAGAKDTAAVRPALMTFGERTLTGSYFGSARPREDFPRLIGLYRNGQLKLDEMVTRTYGIEEAPQAFDDLAQGRNARGVIVFG
ncbi:Zn-dependent alcohol dehydrogenase [Achromobacter sp. GG226]|uniref:Zn-dependent alcohol dehydrogenase n=1 Tax=Verticiella alkaliphila TaxID=2779529 RepID=UPI001C0C0605|nr:Zn-dependent alcohol dehydrogenase [Verticiella sp. GG226]MBU4610775.1 Zn-dependent alcohol dehydrogenase [Verticiella sp. GG226]